MTDVGFSLPKEFYTLTKFPKAKDYIIGLLLGFLIGGSLLGLGILYMNLGYNDWQTWFYLGLGPAIIISVPVISFMVARKGKKYEHEKTQLLERIGHMISLKYGVTLSDEYVLDLIKGNKVDVNINGERKVVYASGLLSGQRTQIHFLTSEQELPLRNIKFDDGRERPLNLDMKKKFRLSDLTNRTVILSFFGFFVMTVVVLGATVGVLRVNLEEAEQIFSWRTVFLIAMVGAMISLAFLPLVTKKAQQLPDESVETVDALLGLAERRYGIAFSRQEAIRLLSIRDTPLSVDLENGQRQRLRLSTLHEGKDVRIMEDISGQELPANRS